MASLDDLINKYSNAEEILRMCVIEALEETGEKIVATAKSNTPVKTGNLRRSIHYTDVNINNNTYTMDTSNILFILAGAFEGIEKIIAKRLNKYNYER